MKDLRGSTRIDEGTLPPPEVARMPGKSGFVVFIDSRNAKGASLYQELDVARGMGKPIIPLRIEHVSPRAQDGSIRFKERLVAALRAQSCPGLIDVWDDTRLRGGDTWRNEIERAIAAAKVLSASCLTAS